MFSLGVVYLCYEFAIANQSKTVFMVLPDVLNNISKVWKLLTEKSQLHQFLCDCLLSQTYLLLFIFVLFCTNDDDNTRNVIPAPFVPFISVYTFPFSKFFAPFQLRAIFASNTFVPS